MYGQRISLGGVVRSHVLRIALATIVVVALFGHGGSAAAQDGGEDIKGNVAGTVGLGLLGAEVGLMLPPLFKLQDDWWAWALFPTVGAAGGAVAGALAFDPGSPSPAVTLSIFGAGAALAVPAVVLAMAFKSKRQNSDKMDTASLLNFRGKRPRLGVPVLATRPTYTAEERLRFGLQQRTAVDLSLVSARF